MILGLNFVEIFLFFGIYKCIIRLILLFLSRDIGVEDVTSKEAQTFITPTPGN